VVVYREAPVVVYSQPAAGVAPEPIIYPRDGQSAQQTEACMDARGYTQR
jgi:hypothetical protein